MRAPTIAWFSPSARASSSPLIADALFLRRFARSFEAAMSAAVGSVCSRAVPDAFAFMNSDTVFSSIDSVATRLTRSGASVTRKRTSRTGLSAVKRTVFANLKTSFLLSRLLSRSK